MKKGGTHYKTHAATISLHKILLKDFRFIRCLPWQRHIITAKMSIRCGCPVNGSAQIKHFDNACGTEIKILPDDFHQFFIAQFSGAEGVYHNGCGLCHSNGISQLNLTLLCQTCRNNVFRHISCGISCASVHLGTVLTGAPPP